MASTTYAFGSAGHEKKASTFPFYTFATRRKRYIKSSPGVRIKERVKEPLP
jgi:hypothetical protein